MNFLLIQVDQLQKRALSEFEKAGKTPNISKILDNGTSFESCTCQYPLCQPSRTSLWTGMYPHLTNVLSNGREWPCKDIGPETKTLGEVFAEGGFKTIHFGKRHDAGSLRGFELDPIGSIPVEEVSPQWPYNEDTFRDEYTTEHAVRFLSTYGYEQPLMMVVDLINPHNICGYVGAHKGPHLDDPVDDLPDLPPDFAFDDIANRSVSIQYICCSHRRQAQTAGWTEENFRHYIAAYRHYLQVADGQIGKILAALETNGHDQDTTIVFFSDHGDCLASRGCVTKQVSMYQDTVDVPLCFRLPGNKAGRRYIGGLAESLDIAPTLCDLAGLEIPSSFDGNSLSPNLRSLAPVDRPYAVSQWHTEWGYTVSPARMIRTQGYKYIHYLEDDFEELYDLANDPCETRNIAKEKAYRTVLGQHRKLLSQYIEKTKDPYHSLTAKADKKWRSHAVGYQNHRGPCASDKQ
jgi:choline-sulfatase